MAGRVWIEFLRTVRRLIQYPRNSMNRLGVICMIVCVTGLTLSEGEEAKQEKPPRYFLANHGNGRGIDKMVDLSEIEGFEDVRTIDDVAKFAAKVPGAVGFTAHPSFETGDRYAHAVVWYTHLSPTSQSWPLHLFDEAEAKKGPGEAARPAALVAAELRITEKLPAAQALMDAAGSQGVMVSAAGMEYTEQKVMALAVMRLGGFFAHFGEFRKDLCLGCRSVVHGGTPFKCGLGVRKVAHWSCCGAEAGGAALPLLGAD